MKLISPCMGCRGSMWGTETGAENQLRFDKPTANNQ